MWLQGTQHKLVAYRLGTHGLGYLILQRNEVLKILQASELWFVHKAYTAVSFHQITVQ